MSRASRRPPRTDDPAKLLSQTFAAASRLTFLKGGKHIMFELNFSSNAERLVAFLLVVALVAVLV